MNKHTRFRRLLALGLLAVFGCLVSAANLVSLEVIHGEEYAQTADQQYSYTRTISASRGEILDRNGVKLVSNSTMYAITIDYAMWPKEGRNEIILKLLDLIDNDATAQMTDTLPIHLRNKQFVFTSTKNDSYKKLKSFCEEQNWPADMDASEVMARLCEYYGVSDSYSNLKKIRIVRVRYQMTREQFSIYNNYTMATNASIDLVTKVMEQHDQLPGVEVETQSKRQINTSTAGNIIGYTGPIYQEDWSQYEDLGYSMDSVVGKVGVEEAFEEYLHGEDGQRTIRTDSRGHVISEQTDREAESGSTTVLTIDSAFQEVVEQSLAEQCQAIDGAEGGAAVVLDVNTGEILAMANYPTYNPQTFQQDFEILNENQLSPLVNRSIASVYAPGSTFKICTAVAGLEEGIIDRYSQIYDQGIYTFYDDYQPRCWIYSAYGTTHGSEDVIDAIKDSCNYFFFETGRLLGAEKLEKYAKKFGLGEYTGIELSGEKRGTVSGPTERAEAVENGTAVEWAPGDTLQSAIGQGDNAFTPLQMANYCAAIANGGNVYAAHLLKEVKSFDGKKTIETIKPEIISKVDASDETWAIVREGMSEVTGEDGTAATVFESYPIQVAGKSGTAQRGEGRQDNGLFISYAPYEEPEIAVCVVIEGGDSGNNVAPVVRDIYNYYFYGDVDYEYEPPVTYYDEEDEYYDEEYDDNEYYEDNEYDDEYSEGEEYYDEDGDYDE